MSNAKGKRGKPDVREVLEVQRGLPLAGEAEAEARPVPQVPQPAAPDGTLPEVGTVGGPEARDSAPFNLDRAIDDLVGSFTDPIIVMPGGWGDTLPEWIKTRITVERMAENMRGLHGEQPTGTDAEAMAYLYTASLTAPMSSEWVSIYMYLFTRVMGDKVPEDLRKEKLPDYEKGLLQEFKRWLWNTRVKARKERRHQERAAEKPEIAAQAPEQLGLAL